MNCAKCHRLILEPNKVYGYAGPVCGCVTPEPKFGPPPLLGVSDTVEVRPVYGATGPEQTLPPHDFVVWLRGYFAAHGNDAGSLAKGDWAAIMAKLGTVRGPK